ncbi:metallo-beta-lactamase domain-containing protein 1 [Cimex lectularius]|uniref:Metallo-beta-lactamase domain-containing protein 1 n=1 Tax=Cimex lectularius TaxID=79782 RepID=A0A8I6R681_CIMLE|nr:metallo-beta-lactamase domain-containing protein 1 [Cimex lectularius]XP_014239171.1 metallo-beta-lactamase domain-containing protein 1 [Cimex lectularius]
MPYKIHIISEGYIRPIEGGGSHANCSCTLVTGRHNVIVDTMTAWDKDHILQRLKDHNVNPDDVDFVVCTHGHSDHVGNNNLFLKAKQIVGHCIQSGTRFFKEPFSQGNNYELDEGLVVIPTPGHTLSCVTLLVDSFDGKVALTGDLFESEDDLFNESVWIEAGSEDPELQRKSRKKVIALADWIIPGHGRAFKVTPEIKSKYGV